MHCEQRGDIQLQSDEQSSTRGTPSDWGTTVHLLPGLRVPMTLTPCDKLKRSDVINRTRAARGHSCVDDGCGAVSRVLPFSPSHAPEACSVAGSKHYKDVSHGRLRPNRWRWWGGDSETGHFRANTQLPDALIVRLWRPAVVWPLRPQPVPAVILRAASLWDADGFVAGIRAVQDGVLPRLGLVGLGEDVSDSGVEVAGGRGRDQTFEFGDAAVVVLLVLLVHSLVTVWLVDCGIHSGLRDTEETLGWTWLRLLR